MNIDLIKKQNSDLEQINDSKTESNIECKFCLDEDKISNLISPCKCDGSLKYVHLYCLEKYHLKKYLEHCEICKDTYEYDKFLDKKKLYSLTIIYSIGILNNFFLLQLLLI